MKILVIAWRAWSAAHRYKSLMLNAQKEGHEVLCIGSNHLSDSTMTRLALNELGIESFIGKAKNVVNRIVAFQPDAVFGEYCWRVAEEVLARDWAVENNKKTFLLDHCQYHGSWIRQPPDGWEQTTLLTVNAEATRYAKKAGWKDAVTIGQPDLDLIERFNTKQIRDRLGVEQNQPLVALFLEHVSGSGSPPGRSLQHERNNMLMFMELANKRNWKVFIHCHGQERRTPEAFYHHAQRKDFLKELQNEGATFVAGFVPCTINGVEFKLCSPFELIATSDAVTGSHLETTLTCYALGKRFFVFYHPNLYGSPKGKTRILYSVYRDEIPSFSTVGKDFSELIDAVENNKGGCKKVAWITKKWFYKLDEKCYQRMLGLI